MTLHRLVLPVVILAAAVVPSRSVAAQPTEEMLHPLHAFVAAYNAGQISPPASVFADDCSTIDDVPPYFWSGAGAAASWWQDTTGANDDKSHKAFLAMHVHVALGEIGDVLLTGDRAYFTANLALDAAPSPGRQLHENFVWIVVEERIESSWVIRSQAWHLSGK